MRITEFLTANDGVLQDDGLTNLQEYLAGTHPNNSASVLKLSVVGNADSIALEFFAVFNLTYSVLYKQSLQDALWLKLAEVAAYPTNRLAKVTTHLLATLRDSLASLLPLNRNAFEALLRGLTRGLVSMQGGGG